MKRLLLLLIPLFFLGGFIYQLMYHQMPDRDPLELVSQDCVLMVDWTDASGVARNFINSRFGRNLTSIDWSYVLDQMAVSGSFRKQIDEKVKVFSGFLASPLCSKLFGDRVVFALLPVDQSVCTKATTQVLADNLLMIASPRSKRILPALLSSIAWVKGKIRSLMYRGRTINSLELDNGGTIYFVFIDGNLVASQGRAAVEKSIDLSLLHLLQEQTGLLTNTDYMGLRKRYKGNDFFVYTDVSRLTLMLNSLKFPHHNAAADAVHSSGVECMALFHSTEKNSQRLISIIRFNSEKLKPFQKTLSARQPKLNSRLPSIPSDLVVYFWSNWLDLSGWWPKSLFKERDAKDVMTDKIAVWIKQQTGLEIDHFLSLFGQEFGLNVTQIRTSGFFPVPSVCCFIELTDSEQVANILKKSLSALVLRHDEVAGVPVVSVMIAQGLMQPSYALLDNYLLIADSREQIEKMLTNRTSRLVDDKLFKAVDTGVMKPANFHVFARTSAIVDSLKELASWVGTVVALRNDAAGRKSKVLVDQVILPLLDGFKTFQAKSIRGYTTHHEVIFDAVVLTGPAHR
jgi:hypothetical protein